MKRFTFTLFFLLMCMGFLMAQDRQVNPREASSLAVDLKIDNRQVPDTVFPMAFYTNPPCADTLYTFTGVDGSMNYAGYVMGTNSYADKEKAQRLDIMGNGNVNEVWVWVSYMTSGTDPGISVKLYDVDGTSQGPGTPLGTSNILPLTSMDTTRPVVPTIFPFAFPPMVTDNFFASVDLSGTGSGSTGDTLNVWGAQVGCGVANGSWEKWSDDQWFDIQGAWGFTGHITMFVAAVVDLEAAGIEDGFMSQRGLTVFAPYPNPATERVNFKFELDQAAPVRLEIYTADGRLIERSERGMMNAGEHELSADVSSLAPGFYTYGIVTDEARLMSKFQVAH